MDFNTTLLEKYPDFISYKSLNAEQTVFRVRQRLDLANGEEKKEVSRIVKIYANACDFFVLKQQKNFFQSLQQDALPIPKLADVRKQGLHYLFVFEDVGKANVIQKIAKKGSFKPKKVKHFLASALQVLEVLAQNQLLHGRIQPSHWVLNQKMPFLVGWDKLHGANSVYENERFASEYEELLYSAPERWSAQMRFASQIYSLGLCLYFLLTGEHLIETLWQAFREQDKSLSKQAGVWQIAWLHQHLYLPAGKDLPKDWQNLLRWMLSPQASSRPTIEQLKAWLEDVEVIQSQSLVEMKTCHAPIAWEDDALKTELADAHTLAAIYENARQAQSNNQADLAFNLFENCVFDGHSDSEVALGEMYQAGQPVSQSYALAATMFYQAFQKGNPNGAYGLGALLLEGKTLPKNVPHAEILFRFAAMRGSLAAQVALGELYAKSPKHLQQARFWLVLAVQRGHFQAQITLTEVLAQCLAAYEPTAMDNGNFLEQGHEIVSKMVKPSIGESIEPLERTLAEEIASVATLAQLISPQKVLQLTTGLQAKMERLMDQEPY